MTGQTKNPYRTEEEIVAPSKWVIARQFLVLSVLIAVLLFQVMFSTRTFWGQVWERNGQIAFAERDWDGARRYYHFASGLNPGNYRALYDLGVSSRNLQDFELAYQAQQNAVLLSPFYAPSLVELAELHIQQGHWKEAASYLERAEKVTPSYWKIYYARGVSASMQGDLDGAALALETGVSVSPESVMAIHDLLGGTYYQMGEWSKALNAIDDAIAMNKNIPRFHVMRGEILLELNRKPAAAKAWEWAAYLYTQPPFNQGANNVIERNALSARMKEVAQ
jgi:tetratricopeptide (TPR) repeat protein